MAEGDKEARQHLGLLGVAEHSEVGTPLLVGGKVLLVGGKVQLVEDRLLLEEGTEKGCLVPLILGSWCNLAGLEVWLQVQGRAPQCWRKWRQGSQVLLPGAVGLTLPCIPDCSSLPPSPSLHR